MNPEPLEELHSYLHKYLRGQIDLDAFDDWFSPLALRLREIESPDLRREVADVEHWLSELSIGYWSEDEFRHLIQQLVQNVHVRAMVSESDTDVKLPVFRTASNSRTIPSFRVLAPGNATRLVPGGSSRS